MHQTYLIFKINVTFSRHAAEQFFTDVEVEERINEWALISGNSILINPRAVHHMQHSFRNL